MLKTFAAYTKTQRFVGVREPRFSYREMADIAGVSVSTLYRKIKEVGPPNSEDGISEKNAGFYLRSSAMAWLKKHFGV